MLFKKSFRFASGFVVLLFLVTLYSCVEPETPTPTPPPTPTPNPTPDQTCHAHVTTGYTNKTSYFPDEKVIAFLQSNEAIPQCRLDIYDIKGRLAFSILTPLTIQAEPSNSPSINGFGFNPTIEFDIPNGTPSGVYQIENKIPFIVKTRNKVDLMIVYPSNTVNAYCDSGGKSLYTSTGRPTEVSFLRPMGLQSFSTPGLAWFSTLTEFSIGYIADIDLDNSSTFENSTILVIAGHNEYWTRAARINFDAYVNNGGHALVLSGNTMWWQVRYSDDMSKLICYKYVNDPISDPLLKTSWWGDPLLQYPIMSSIGADFPHGGYGLKTDNGWNGFKITNPDSPLLEGLNLKTGDIISVPTSEYDGAPISHLDGDGYPVIDQAALHVEKFELIGFDRGFREVETFGTFFVMKRNSTSGIIVNTCSTDWCSEKGMGGSSGDQIKKITHNAIEKLLHQKNVFSK